MADFSEFKRIFTRIESLERELNLRQLQINRLLNITQAINNNVSARDLYRMYHDFLSWELEIKKMALFVPADDNSSDWQCTAHVGLSEACLQEASRAELAQFTQLVNLDRKDHVFLREFDLVIPVLHKDQPIAYVFIGGFTEDDDVYEKVQFITTITNIIAVAIENKRLFKRQLEQERMRREMELASEMQRMLIPQRLPHKSCYELSSIYKPLFGVGGDYFDFIEFPDGKIVFCIGDISGKGVAAALLMANFQANFHTLINKRTALDEFILDLNQTVTRITRGEKFLTFFIAEYDMTSHTLHYINAGHNPPVLVSRGELQLLTEGCTVLGSFNRLPHIGIGRVKLEDESIILAYTDGLTDLQNEAGDYFDEELLHDFVRQHCHLPPVEFNDRLIARLEVFRGDEGYPDDFTVLTSRFVPNPKPC
jgi:sigma-B regulation protein RsbU (phosphoserine phosphatase)